MPSSKMATCHPHRVHKAHGLCSMCIKRHIKEHGPFPRKPRMVATCHPNRKHKALGLCDECYNRQRYSPVDKPRAVATCHPERPHLALGKCKQCYHRDRYNDPEIGKRIRDYQEEYRKLA